MIYKLPTLKLADNKIERETAIKFLEVMQMKKYLTKHIGPLFRAKPLLEEKSLKSIYFAHILWFLNYANITWVSISRTKLRTIRFHQRHIVRIIFMKTN